MDAAHRARARRPRLDDQPRQRRHRAGRGGRADRRPRVAGAADPDDAGAAGRRSASWPAPRRRPENAEAPDRGVRRRRPDARRGHPQHRQPDDARRRATRSTSSPRRRTAHVDGRFLPGFEDEFFATIADAVRRRASTSTSSPTSSAWETPYDGDLVDAMTRSLLAEDPEALVAPYLMSGGTDAKHFNKLGMRSYGFAPLRLPADLDFTGAVPRRRRAGAGRRAGVRGPGLRPVPRPGLKEPQSTPRSGNWLMTRRPTPRRTRQGCQFGHQPRTGSAPGCGWGANRESGRGGACSKRVATNPRRTRSVRRIGCRQAAGLRRCALPDDLAPQDHPAGAVGRDPHPVELPAAVLGALDQQPGHARCAGDSRGEQRPFELPLHPTAAGTARRPGVTGGPRTRRRAPRRSRPAGSAVLEPSAPLELCGGPRADDRGGDAGAVAHPGERDLERSPARARRPRGPRPPRSVGALGSR